MSKRFEKFVAITLRHEGGYVNDLDDTGGETNFGISRRFLDKLGLVNEDIKSMTEERAKFLYHIYFWPYYMDVIDDDLTALMLFDFGVNAGRKRAVRFLQRAANVKADGVFGPQTLAAVQDSDPDMLQKRFLRQIMLFYVRLAQKKDTAYIKFLRNWTLRVFSNFTYDKDALS